MDLGWLDVCLKVADVKTSRAFYEGLGFHVAEGELDEGWVVMVNGDARLGLFQVQFMGKDALSLNFRGGDVANISRSLAEKGYPFERALKTNSEGGASASLRDPDGYLIFLDSAPGETKKT